MNVCKPFQARRRVVSSGDQPNNNSSRDYWSFMSNKLFNLLDTKRLIDVNLKIENEIFAAHKVILAASAPYFEIMFSDEFSERSQSTIEIHGIGLEAFRSIFNFIYKGELELDENNIQEVIAGANMFQMELLMGLACDFLKKHLDKSNCLGVYRLMDMYSFTTKSHMLKMETKKFVEMNFVDVVDEEDFLDLPYEIYVNLLRSEGLCIHNELIVLDASVRWLMHDPEKRFKYVDSLMKLVRLPTIPQKLKEKIAQRIGDERVKQKLVDWFRMDSEKKLVRRSALAESVDSNQNDESKSDSTVKKVMPEEDVVDGSERGGGVVVGDKVVVASNFDLGKQNRSLVFNLDLRWRPRMGTYQNIYLIGGINRQQSTKPNSFFGIGSSTPFVDKLDGLKSVWKRTCQMIHPRCQHQGVEMDGMIYVAGGLGSRGKLSSVEVFDPIENKWKLVHPMGYPRSNFLMLAYEGYLYVFGGCTIDFAPIERYDPELDEWEEIIPFDNRWKNFNGVVFNSKIILAGGMKPFGHTNEVKSFDPHTNSWEQFEPMLSCRSGFGMTTLHDYMYVAGGFCGHDNEFLRLRSVERYSVRDGKWQLISDLNSYEMVGNLIKLNNKIIVMAIRTNKNQQVTMDVYDPEINAWRMSQKLPIVRYEVVVVVY